MEDTFLSNDTGAIGGHKRNRIVLLEEASSSRLCATAIVSSYTQAVEQLLVNSIGNGAVDVFIELRVDKQSILIEDNGTVCAGLEELGESAAGGAIDTEIPSKMVPNPHDTINFERIFSDEIQDVFLDNGFSELETPYQIAGRHAAFPHSKRRRKHDNAANNAHTAQKRIDPMITNDHIALSVKKGLSLWALAQLSELCTTSLQAGSYRHTHHTFGTKTHDETVRNLNDAHNNEEITDGIGCCVHAGVPPASIAGSIASLATASNSRNSTSRIHVTSLFKHIPVRQRMKSPKAELVKCVKLVEAYAVLNPCVAFTLRAENVSTAEKFSHKTDTILAIPPHATIFERIHSMIPSGATCGAQVVRCVARGTVLEGLVWFASFPFRIFGFHRSPLLPSPRITHQLVSIANTATAAAQEGPSSGMGGKAAEQDGTEMQRHACYVLHLTAADAPSRVQLHGSSTLLAPEHESSIAQVLQDMLLVLREASIHAADVIDVAASNAEQDPVRYAARPLVESFRAPIESPQCGEAVVREIPAAPSFAVPSTLLFRPRMEQRHSPYFSRQNESATAVMHVRSSFSARRTMDPVLSTLLGKGERPAWSARSQHVHVLQRARVAAAAVHSIHGAEVPQNLQRRCSCNGSALMPSGTSLHRDIFTSLSCVGQLDCKFILATSGSCQRNAIFIIDQHAADERIRVEQLEYALFGAADIHTTSHGGANYPCPATVSADGMTLYSASTVLPGTAVLDAVKENQESAFKMMSLIEPLPIEVQRGQLATLQLYSSILEAWGFVWDVPSPLPAIVSARDAVPGLSKTRHVQCRSIIYVTRQPVLWEVPVQIEGFLEFLESLQDRYSDAPLHQALPPHHLRCLLYHTGMYPPDVRRIMNSKACRGAVMFGDKLQLAECRRLLHRLSRCNTPFQCAHGRPVIVPLVTTSSSCE